MCGIMGFYCFSNKKPEKEKISEMFSLLESRGRDASGFAFIKEDGNLFVHKAAIRSSEMVKTGDWQALELSKIMIMHTRMKTQGSEKNNANNHPIFNKNGIALVHNGMIINDHSIFINKKRDGEVDSEALLAVLASKHKGNKIRRLFDTVEGCFAVAVINKAEPDKLILIKKDNPIDIYYNSADDILYFCSERDIMKRALDIKSISRRGFNIGETDYHFYEMENNHALIINSEGAESYKKYYSSIRNYYRDRHKSITYHKDIIEIECPWCLSPTSYVEGRLRNQCDYCGIHISEEDLYNAI